jgi:glycosyltransferase involved in cell wall biosynthesis
VPLQVSVIMTVFNEALSITHLLDSLAAQSRMPDEIVIVDGGSTDNTPEILTNYVMREEVALHTCSRPGANISQGRNAAIAAAHGQVIAVTDAGVRLDPSWLEELIRPFEQDAETNIVAGFFVPDPQTPFEVAMGATVLPDLKDVVASTFLPSSRSVAFRKKAWSAIGGYPEWLDYCEDVILDLELVQRYGPFHFAPRALVYFRPRSNMRSFFLQYYRYARGDGKANLWPKRHAVRYVTYLLLLPAFAVAAWRLGAWWLLGLLAGGAAYTFHPYRRLGKAMRDLWWAAKLYAIALVPLIRVVGDVAKMIGYPAGWMWRLRHRDEVPR